MVAIVSGNSLGLSLTSLATLANRQPVGLGSAAQGSSGERAYVDASTGNLVLQDIDDQLLGIGQGLNVQRTYNSLGQMTDDNGDNWTNGATKSVTLTGTLLAAGSTITRTDRDGSLAVYTFDTTQNLYVNHDGAGAFDTISYDSTAAQYVWTDGGSQLKERYEGTGAGRILSSVDPVGNTLTYAYGTNGLLASVQDANGESMFYDYTGTLLTQVRTVVQNGTASQTITRVHYTYDTSNRLSTVSVDLSPNDNATTDGKVYKTTYTYDGTSKRVSGIVQSDGTSLAFTYVLTGSTYRIASYTDGLNDTTTFSYDLTALKTTVTDPLGKASVYSYDANGQLVQVGAPAVGGSIATTAYQYDASGNVVRVTDGSGNAVALQYDAKGNLVLQRDTAGNTETFTYDAQNRLLTDTQYAIPDPDGTGAAQPGLPETTRYVYDAANHGLLRYVITPQGRVTEYQYNASGERTSSIQYAATLYLVAGLAQTAVPTEAQVLTWTGTIDKTQSLRADMVYDARGQLTSTTTYASVASTGAGVADGTQSVTQYVRDQTGNLLKTIDGNGKIAQYTYDGLNRVLSVTDALNQVTLSSYDDANGKATVTQANGLITTSVYDKAGRLISVVQTGPAAAVLGTTQYFYDADGHRVMTQDPTGVKSFSLYDEDGRKVVDIDGNGNLSEYIYNAANLLTKTIRYATTVNTALLVNAQGSPAGVTLAAVRPTTNSADQATWNAYDAAGRLVKTVNSQGAVVETRYDGASQVTQRIQYASSISVTGLTNTPTAASIAPVASANDRTTANYYDSDGLLISTLDPAGYVVQYTYDAAGRLTGKTSYARTINVAPVAASAIADQTVLVGGVYGYVVPASTVTDADAGDTLTWTATQANGTALPTWLTFNAATRTFSGTPPAGSGGSLVIKVIGTDHAGAQAATVFNLTVDDAPVIATIPTQNAFVGSPWLFSALGASDVDVGDTLVYRATLSSGAALPAWLHFDPVAHAFSGTPSATDFGSIAVNLVVTDESGVSTTRTFNIAVNSVPVAVVPIADRTAQEGTAFTYAFPTTTFSDANSIDILSYSATLASGAALPSWLTFNASTRMFSGTPPAGSAGVIAIQVRATDTLGGAVSTQFDIEINSAPTIGAALATQYAPPARLFGYTLPSSAFADLTPGDVLSYSVKQSNGTALPSWLTFNPVTLKFSGTPASANYGTLTLTVTATDRYGAVASTALIIKIDNPPAAASVLFSQVDSVGRAFSYVVPSTSFSDLDADTLSYSATLADGTALPTWLTFNSATRTFSGTPTAAGTYSVKVIAQDAAGVQASSNFSLVVVASGTDSAPYVQNGIASQYVSTSAVNFTMPVATFTDIDAGDTLTYSATLADGTALPSWLTFNATTHVLSGTAPANGRVSVKVTAKDVSGQSTSDTFDLIVVTAPPVQASPLTAGELNQSVFAGSAYSFNLPASIIVPGFNDGTPAHSAITWSATLLGGAALPSWLTFSAPSGTSTIAFSGTPATANAGTYQVVLSATSGGSVLSQTFTIVVDQPPVAAVIPSQSANAGVAWTATVPVFTDPDSGDVLTYSANQASGAALPAWISFNAATRTFTGTPGAGDSGTYTVKVAATDKFGQQTSATFTLSVDSAPIVVVPIANQSVMVGATYQFAVPVQTFFDGDPSDTLSYSATLSSGAALPSWLTFDPASRTFNGSPAITNAGLVALKVIVTDQAGRQVSTTFNLMVDQAPSAATLANQTLTSGSAWSYTAAAFVDPNSGDTLTYVATLSSGAPLPAWLHFNAATHTFSGTPGASDVGAVSVKLTAVDGSGAQASSVTTLTIGLPAIPTLNGLQIAPVASSGDIHTTTIYNAKDQVAGVIDGEGYLTESVYDAAGNVTKTVRYATPVSAAIVLGVTVAQVRPASSAEDHVVSYVYDGDNRVTQQTDIDGTVSQYVYDSVGNVLTKTTAVGTTDVRTLTARYDLLGHMVAQLSGDGSAKLTGNQTQTQIDQIWASYATHYTYDLAGRRVSSTDADGNRTLYFYDNDSNLRFTVNGLGEVTENQYDARSELTATTQYGTRIGTTGLAGGLIPAALTTAVTAARNGAIDRTTSYQYNVTGTLAKTIDAVGSSVQLGYDVFGEETSSSEQIDASHNRVEALVYDKRGEVVQTTDDATGVNAVSSMQYDAFGRLIKTTNPNGAINQATYDRLGRVVTQTDGTSASTSTVYDAFDRVLSTTDPLGHTTHYTYNTAARSVTMTSAGGIVVTTVLNREGQRQSITDGRGTATTYSYDQDGNLLTVKTPLTTTTQAYDNADLLIKTTDAAGHTLTYTYDAAQRILTKSADTTGLNLTTRYQYDARGEAISVTDANGIVTQYTFDLKGQVIKQAVDPSGLNLVTAYTYDGIGDVLTVTAPTGTVTQYTYDNLGRRTATHVDPTGLNLVTIYVYDKNDNLVTATDPNGNVTRYAYDADDRLVYKVDGAGDVEFTSYDAAGRVTKVVDYATPITATALAALATAPTVAAVQAVAVASATDSIRNNVYDVDNRLIAVVDGVGDVVKYTYDANGNVISTTAFENRIAIASWTAGTLPSPSVDAARDQTIQTIYDALNRAIYSIDGVGAVTARTYDGDGNALSVIRYATKIPASTAATATAIAAVVATVADSTRDAAVRNVFDNAGRLTYTADGTGAVVRYIYDADGNVIKRVAFATAIAAGVSPSTAISTASDRVTAFVYDNAGRVIYKVDPFGAVVKTVYDANGNVAMVTSYALTITAPTASSTYTATSLLSSEPGNATADRVTRFTYDAANRQVFAVDGTGAVVETLYDAVGNIAGTHAYATRLTAAALATLPAVATTSATRALLTTSATADRITRAAYDAAGRLVYSVDPLGYVTKNQFDGLGQVTKTTLYATAIAATVAGTISGITAAVVANASNDQTLQTVYDAAGNVLTKTDALGAVQTYVYDGLGQPRSYKDKNGGVWLYDYDAAGRKTSQTSPSVALSSVTATADGNGNLQNSLQATSAGVVTQMTYDALGNLMSRIEAVGRPETRTTKYRYDADGRQIMTILPSVGVYSAESVAQVTANGATGAATRTDTALTLYSLVTYDAFGDIVANRDFAGNMSYKAYDQGGHVAYDVDAEGYVTGYRYDAFGDATSLIRYAVRTQLTAAGSTVPSAATVAAAVNATGVDHSLDRLLQTTFDQDGRTATVTTPQGFFYDTNATGSAQNVVGSGQTQNTYDAFGDITRTAVLNNTANNTWNATNYYYDSRGKLVAMVDPIGYVTKQTFDAAGNTLTHTEYATAVASWNGAAPPAAPPAPTASASDRTTQYAYDRNNRLVTMTRVSVQYSDTGNGNSVTGNLSTTYGYDNAGNQTRVTVSNAAGTGDATYTYYDALGRVIAVAQPTRSSTVGGTALIPLTVYRRDALGNVVNQTVYANGAVAANATTYTIGTASAADRSTTTQFDSRGNAVSTTDANGITTFKSYDANGNLAKSWQTVGTVGQFHTSFEVYQYDRLGQKTHVIDPASTSVLQSGVTLTVTPAPVTVSGGVPSVHGTNTVTLGWSAGIVNPAGGTVQVEFDYVTVSTLHQIAVDEVSEPMYGGSASRAASQVKSLTASAAASGVTLSWTDNGDGGISQSSYVRVYQADASGNMILVWQGSPAQANGSGFATLNQMQAGVNDTAITYDAFGDTTGKGVNGGHQEYFTYDQAGRLWRTNSQNGVDTVYLYDASGNQTAQIASAGTGLGNLNLLNYADAQTIAGLTSVRRSNMTYDADGHLIKTVEPQREQQLYGSVSVNQINTGVRIASTASYTDQGRDLLTWNGLNSVGMSWNSLSGLGSGDVKVVVDYTSATYEIPSTDFNDNNRPPTSQPTDSDESSGITSYVFAGVAQEKQQVVTSEQGATGFTMSWFDADGSSVGGVSSVDRLRVYKKDAQGQWQLVIDQNQYGVSGNVIQVAAPADPTTTLQLQYRLTGATAWTTASMVDFGDAYRFDGSGLAAGQYQYQVVETAANGTVTTTSNGNLSLSGAPLAAITTPISYPSSTSSLFEWHNPGASTNQVFRYRVSGSGSWNTATITHNNNGIDSVDTSGLAAGNYDFELLWFNGNNAAPSAHATGAIVVVASVAAVYVPPKNLPEISGVTAGPGMVGGITVYSDESGAPSITGGHPTTVVQWPIQDTTRGSTTFLYRPAGSGAAWNTLSVYTESTGSDESTFLGFQNVDIGGLGPGNYEYVIQYTQGGYAAPTEQETGVLTVNGQGAGHYDTVNVQVPVQVTITPPDPSAYIIGWTQAQYSYPVEVGVDGNGAIILGAHYQWQGNVVVGVPWTQTQVVGYTTQTVAVQVPQREPIILGYDENGAIYLTDESGNIEYTTVWVTQYQQQTVPVYGPVTYYPADPNQYLTVPSHPIYGEPVVYHDENGTTPAAHYAWQGYYLVAVPYTVTQYQTQQQQVWVPGTTPPPTITDTTPTYVPGYTIAAIPKTYGSSTSTAAGSTAISQNPTIGSPLALSATLNGVVTSALPTVIRTVDRWGNVLSETDPRNAAWKSTYQYNANNEVTQVVQTSAAGGGAPTTTYYYDRNGRQIATRDADNHVNGLTYDAAGNVVQEIHADGGVVNYAYDVFGDKVKKTDAMGYVTQYSYSNLGQLLQTVSANVVSYSIDTSYNVTSLGVSTLTESYSYDQAGHLLTDTNANGETIRYAYDLAGNVISKSQPGVQAVLDAYDPNGQKIAEIDGNGIASTWQYDYFGLLLAHTDVGGARYSYTYDNARQLITQTSNVGQNLHNTYDAAGQLTRIDDTADGKTTIYAYDNAGNHVEEKTIQGGVVYQDNHLAYDALNRLKDITSDAMHVSISYDLVGNRTLIGAHVINSADQSQDSNRYFAYDAMNRQILVDGVSGNSVSQSNINSAQGHLLTYDKNGNRLSDTYVGTKVVQSGSTYVAQQGAVVTESYTYDQENRLVTGLRDGVMVDTREYDKASRVVQSGPFGTLSRDYIDALNNNTNGYGNETYQTVYSGDVQANGSGQIIGQRVLKYANNQESLASAYSYDGEGNLLGYTNTINGTAGYTAHYTFTQARFDGYQQATETGQINGASPGTTTNGYDHNGYLTSVTDSTQSSNNKTLVNDAQGHVLYENQAGHVQHELVVNGEVLAQYGDRPDATSGSGFSNQATYNFGYRTIDASYPAPSPGLYTVQPGDTLESMALSAYGDSSAWYLIADANGLKGDSDLRVGQALTIPNNVSSVNAKNTFLPYDASRIVGNTNPALPQPSDGKGGCGGIGQILIAAVVVAVAIASGQAELAFEGVTEITAATAGQLAVAGAVAGVTASTVGQALNIAAGYQHGFDIGQVALAGVSSAITGGLTPGGGYALTTLGTAEAVGTAALASTVTQGLGVLTGIQHSFSWTDVVAQSVAAGVGSVAQQVGKVADLGRVQTGILSAFAGGAAGNEINGGGASGLAAAVGDSLGSIAGNIGDSTGGGASDSRHGSGSVSTLYGTSGSYDELVKQATQQAYASTAVNDQNALLGAGNTAPPLHVDKGIAFDSVYQQMVDTPRMAAISLSTYPPGGMMFAGPGAPVVEPPLPMVFATPANAMVGSAVGASYGSEYDGTSSAWSPYGGAVDLNEQAFRASVDSILTGGLDSALGSWNSRGGSVENFGIPVFANEPDHHNQGASESTAVPARRAGTPNPAADHLNEQWNAAKNTLVDASARAGVDPRTVVKIAAFESQFSPSARPISRNASMNRVSQFDGVMAISSAYGYGQFTDDSWTDILNRYGAAYGVANAGQLTRTAASAYRTNANLQASMLAEFTKTNIATGRTLGGSSDDANAYALHNLGSRGGRNFLSALATDPRAQVRDILSQQVIRGNPSLYGDGSITVRDAYNRMAAVMGNGDRFADEASALLRARDGH